jgi:hypothetical protein
MISLLNEAADWLVKLLANRPPQKEAGLQPFFRVSMVIKFT